VSSFGDNGLKNNKSENRLLAIPFPPRPSLRRAIAALCGATFASVSSLAFALGLGEMSSSSYLGQPLKATIDLVSLEGDIDPQTIIVRQVAPDEARKMGVDIFNVPYRIDFQLDARKGAPSVTLTSREPINEPYLSLLVELRWPKGVVYREYPLLLDPPPLVPVREVPKETPRVVSQPATSQPSRSTPTSTRSAPSQIRLEPLVTDQGKYKVKPGDTLSKIAERWREGTSQSIGDTAQWLFENNPHAFANNNINRLRAGAVLQMPDLTAYRLDETARTTAPSLAPLPKTGSGEGLSGAEAVADQAAQEARRNAGNDAAQSGSVRGLLTIGTDSRDDRTRELIDLLVRENETLKARMEKLESSEYLDTLKQLIVLQRQQISDLREKLGVPDNDVSQEMDTLLGEIGVPVDNRKKADVSLATQTSAPVPLENNVQTESIIDVEPAITPPVTEKESKSWLMWLLFGAAVALSALFIGMFAYYRRMVPAKRVDEEPVGPRYYSPATSVAEKRVAPVQEPDPVEFDDGDLTPVYAHKKKNEEDWIGEKVTPVDPVAEQEDETVREVQEAFEDLVLDEDILKSLESLDDLPIEDLTQALPEAEEFSVQPVVGAETPIVIEEPTKKRSKKDKNAHPTRRPDEEVRMSIAEKMAQYNPDEYRKEMENLELMELDEVELNDATEEDVETVVYRAMMFCEFKKYDKAREVIEGKMAFTRDARLIEALDQIDSLEREAQANSKKAI
jgi:FimV-like protein